MLRQRRGMGHGMRVAWALPARGEMGAVLSLFLKSDSQRAPP